LEIKLLWDILSVNWKIFTNVRQGVAATIVRTELF